MYPYVGVGSHGQQSPFGTTSSRKGPTSLTKLHANEKVLDWRGGGAASPPRLLSLGTWGEGRRRDGTPCVSLPCHVWIFHYWDPKPLSSSSPLFSICVLERNPIMVWNHPPPLPLIDYTSLSKPFRCFLPNILCLLILMYLIPTCLPMKYLYSLPSLC